MVLITCATALIPSTAIMSSTNASSVAGPSGSGSEPRKEHNNPYMTAPTYYPPSSYPAAWPSSWPSYYPAQYSQAYSGAINYGAASSSAPAQNINVRIPSPPTVETPLHWDLAVKQLLSDLALHQARRGFEMDMLAMNPEWEKENVSSALKTFVKQITVRCQFGSIISL